MKILLMEVSNYTGEVVEERLLILIGSLCQPDKQKWKELEMLINKVQDNFAVKLRLSYPFLSEDDIHIVLMLRIGLNHTQISEILNILKSSFRIRRYRLKKKMDVKCESISDFIKNLDF